MNAHTPGPWTVTEEYIERDQFMEHPVVSVEGEELLVADVYDTLDDEASTPEARLEQARANARLVAAAPRMAALLLSAWQHVSHGGPKRGEVEDVLREAGLITTAETR